MRHFRDYSIKSKLILLILFITISSLLAGFTFIVINDIVSLKKEMVERTVLLAKIIGDYSVTDLAFNDRTESKKTLAKLANLPNIEYASLHDIDGNLFSEYRHTEDPLTHMGVTGTYYFFEGGFLHVYEPVVHASDTYGTIYLKASINPLKEKVGDYVRTIVFLIVFLTGLAFLFSYRLQGLISRPILDLAKTTEEISKGGDYSIRAEKIGDDEIGILYQNFNSMLEQIQKREKERDKAEAALKASEQKFRHLIEQSNDAIYVLKGIRMAFVNPQFEEYFEYTLEELLAPEFSVEKLVTKESGTFIRELIDRRERGEEVPNRYVFQGISKSGRILDFEVNMTDIEWDNEPAILGTLRDVTRQIQYEKQLKEQRGRLEIYAKELERSNAELEQFAYVASHDLQEPLRKVTTFGDKFFSSYKSVMDDRGRDYLERMRNAAERMQILIDDLLTYSRVTSRAQPFSPVNLQEVVSGVLSDLEILIDKNRDRIIVDDLPTIDADLFQMRQLFQNLIANALKFQKEGIPPEIRIGGKIIEPSDPSSEDNGSTRMCRITVEDNGIGFEEKYLGKIFTIFQRLHSRKEYKGTGIGLAICHKIVERHGGTITAESKLGEGATFIISIPVTQKGGAWYEESQ